MWTGLTVRFLHWTNPLSKYSTFLVTTSLAPYRWHPRCHVLVSPLFFLTLAYVARLFTKNATPGHPFLGHQRRLQRLHRQWLFLGNRAHRCMVLSWPSRALRATKKLQSSSVSHLESLFWYVHLFCLQWLWRNRNRGKIKNQRLWLHRMKRRQRLKL